MFPRRRARPIVRAEPEPDARQRAEATLRAARSRDAGVVTLDTAGSPADALSTLRIPRHVVTAADPRAADPDSTQIISTGTVPPAPRRG